MKIFKTFIFALILLLTLPFSSFANHSVEEIIKGRKAMFSENYQNGKKISILHCTTQYPAPFSDVNLNVIKSLKKKFNCKIGYSDHTTGIEVAIAAVAMGATIIEKHLTFDKKMKGPDHKASLEPHEFKNMVLSIRNIEKSFGSFKKVITKSEKKNILIARKSIVASKFIEKGEKFTLENITVKRPSLGLSPTKWFSVLGKTAKKNYFEFRRISIKDMELSLTKLIVLKK